MRSFPSRMNNAYDYRISSSEGVRYFFIGGIMQGEQKIVISDRNKVEIDSVKAVKSFDEDGVLIESSLGKISIEGKELLIENFEKATGRILITGNIIGVYYLEKAEKKKGRGLLG